jgi:phosphomannomutase
MMREVDTLVDRYVVPGNPAASDYFGLIHRLVSLRQDRNTDDIVEAIEQAYDLVRQEIVTNSATPQTAVSFGTSGWRGILGKDFFVKSVCQVTRAVISTLRGLDQDPALAKAIGISSFAEAQKRGGVVGFDSRFCGDLLAIQVGRVLVEAGFRVLYCGETTTGVLSSTVMQQQAAFSINLTPSHNPLDYGGFKFNGADAGPASSRATGIIGEEARKIIAAEEGAAPPDLWTLDSLLAHDAVERLDSLDCWQDLVAANQTVHGLNLKESVAAFVANEQVVIGVDCMHGASRIHVKELFGGKQTERLVTFRDVADVTFGGVAPEPSEANLIAVRSFLREREEEFKIGAIIDPDGDRIRFTDGERDIGMNQFGAMAYHFLHEYKGVRGQVGKTVATSNFANAIARAFREECYEPAVGFKNFKEVVGRAVVLFEESDGITIIGHTPEKDAYIGLLLALEMVLTTGMPLGQYLDNLGSIYGTYFPQRGSIEVAAVGPDLLEKLQALNDLTAGKTLVADEQEFAIAEVITIDGHKLIFSDGSWLMIRPSGTEPKVRYYVESRTEQGTQGLINAAHQLLLEAGVLAT